jgi:hypothetical protein
VYDFGKVNSGEVVKHDFVFTNIGTATLEIRDVRPGCGCTTAGTWDKQVEPGKTGIIPLQFDSTEFFGKVTKSAMVMCNDAGQSDVVLDITGTVWTPIQVMPSMLTFNVSSEIPTNVTKIVRLVSNLDEPITLSDLQCTNRAFNAELKTVRPGKEFELAITAVPPFISSPVLAPVTLKTSSPEMPVINVSAHVIVQQPVAVMPAQINLPPGPLLAGLNIPIAIRSTGTNALALSDARVNVPGLGLRMQEVQPGRLFTLRVDFPAGFQIKADQKVEVTVKSNHPKTPLITVPVMHLQRPAVPVGTQSASSQVQVVPAQAASPAGGK